MVGVDVLLVGYGVVGGEEDGAASESGFDGVEGGDGFAFGATRAGRQEGVAPVGNGAGGHGGFETFKRGGGSHRVQKVACERAKTNYVPEKCL